MSFLRMLAERTIGAPPTLMPRLPSRYETPQIDFNAPTEIDFEQEVSVTAAAPSEPAAADEGAGKVEPPAPAGPSLPETGQPRPPGIARTPAPSETGRPAARALMPIEPARPAEHADRSETPRAVVAPHAALHQLEQTDAEHAPGRRGADPAVTESEGADDGRQPIRAAEPLQARLLPLRPAEPHPRPAPANQSALAERPSRDVAEEPTVRIHIGRIEVRAVTETNPPAPRPAPGPSRLDAYLKARNGERR